MNLKRLMVCGNRVDNGKSICGLLVDATTEMGSDRIIKAAIKPTPTERYEIDPETLEPMGIKRCGKEHIPSGETWVVCGVRHERNELIPCGYPFPSFAKISDCELTEKGDGTQSQEYIDALKRAGCESFIVPPSPSSDELLKKWKKNMYGYGRATSRKGR